MKKMLFLAFAATSILATSCGKKTLAQEIAGKICACPATQEMVKLQKEMDGKSDVEKEAMAAKKGDLQKQVKDCMGDVEAKAKALPADQLAKFPGELEAAVTKQCPDIAKAMNSK